MPRGFWQAKIKSMAFIPTSCLVMATLCQSVSGALQPPRRVGMQAFRLMDTLWITGGRFLHENASVALTDESHPQVYNLTLDFQLPDGPRPDQSLDDAPAVYHGFTFSNLVDRAWLFGGRPVDPAMAALENDIWRFEPAADPAWTRLPLGLVQKTLLRQRPYRGAGCNVPDLKRGYYLGGMTDDEGGGRVSHLLYEFDMESEGISVFEVPMFVPVVNQSLVFLDTGSRQGALVALGGSVETNGSLSPEPLDSVFIFDIESRTWMKQAVSGLGGDMAQDDRLPTEAPSGGIPRTRVSGCAVVGSAQDKTSHNILYLGGANETSSLPDIWVLSLPAAVWIKARPLDPFSSPKIENSCFVVNDRFLWMFGGCFSEPHGLPCKAYSYNPLVYDMELLRMEHYKDETVGFFVHENISAVIGGNHTGGAEQVSPMFTSFSNPLLQQLFRPPYSDRLREPDAYQYDHRTGTYLFTFLLLPVVLGSLLYIIAPRCSLKSPFKLGRPPRKPWHPSVFSPEFLIFLNLVTIFYVALIAMLTQISQVRDADPGRWYGGPDADGVWTGEKYRSTFIRSPTLARPPQGLISFYQDAGLEGIWSQKNSTQRIGAGNYWAFAYLPTLVAVLYGRLWKVLDDEVKRIDMYARLQRPGGEKAADSLFLQYHSFWVPLSIYQAFRRGQWRVAISSLGVTLGSVMAPIIQGYVFAWTLYSGAHLSWPGTYSWLVALVDQWWSNVLIGILSCALLCSLSLLVLLPQLDTGLQQDPRGLSSIVYLIPDGFPSIPKACNTQTLSDLHKDLGHRHFQLSALPGNPMPVLGLVTPTSQQTTRSSRSWIPTTPIMTNFLSRTTKHRLSLKTQLTPLTRLITNYLTNHPLSFPLRPEIFTLWLLLLLTLLTLTSLVLTGINQNARDRLWNYTVPLSPNIYLILAIFIQSIADVIDFNIRCLHPFYELRRGAQTADILFTDYVASLSSRGVFSIIPLADVVVAWSRGHHLVCLSALASLGITVVAVFLGSLQLSSSYYGATSFLGDQTAATGAAWLVGLAVVVYAALWWRVRWVLGGEGKGMKRPVESVMGVAPYVVFSEGLREDLLGVARLAVGRYDGGERARELERRGSRYAMGVWTDSAGHDLYGVERQYDGRGRVDVSRVI